MARRYHKLDKNQVRTLKLLSGKNEPDDTAPIEHPRKSKNKAVPGKKKILYRYIKQIKICYKGTAKRSEKPVNKRQKRKKMIRDELKRQLSMNLAKRRSRIKKYRITKNINYSRYVYRFS